MIGKNAWMLDVIADLRQFAELNDLPRLARDLDRVAATARSEIASPLSVVRTGMLWDECTGRTASRPAIAGEDA